MRILLVNKFLYPNGGSETYIFELGKELMKNGHEVQYFGMEHTDRIVGNHAESYTTSMDFHSNKVQKILYPFKIIYSQEARRKIRIVLNDFKPDIVHLNNINFQITPSVIYEIRKWEKRYKFPVSIVYTAHDYQWVCPNHMMFIPDNGKKCFQCRGGKFKNCFKNKCIHNSSVRSLLGMIEGSLYKHLKTYEKVDLIICPSQFMKQQLSSEEILEKKLKVIYNFLYDEMQISVEKKSYVLYFGRFAKEKGILTLVKACSLLPHINFVFAGSGILDEAISGCENIKNVGFQIGKELKKLIAEAKFSVFPSEWYENCPFSVMESQYFGTPVIASNIGGIPELLENGVTGELFVPGNVEDLKKKIEDLWNDEEKLKKYTANCLEKKFDSIEEYGKKILNLYKGLKENKLIEG